jgi:hypothetical protein
MKLLIAALAAAFLFTTPTLAVAQNQTPTKTEKSQKAKGANDRAAVDCKKAENANNQACMKAAKEQSQAQKTKKNAPKTN